MDAPRSQIGIGNLDLGIDQIAEMSNCRPGGRRPE
jgi:hypothetical protein